MLILTGCTGSEGVVPPAQQTFPTASRHAMFAADPEAEQLIVSDIRRLEGGRFRWTGQAPAVRLALEKTEGIHLRARFWIPEAALQQTGPIGIAYQVNGHLLGRGRYSTPGEQQFDAPVDAGWLRAAPDNEVRLDIDKTYESNGVRLGVALVELGFAD